MVKNILFDIGKGEWAYALQGDHIRLSRRDLEVNVPVLEGSLARCHIDRCLVRDSRLQCTGWGFSRSSGEPFKRILGGHEGLLLGQSVPVERNDVRSKLNLDYDHAGFTLDVVMDNPPVDGENIDLFFVDTGGVILLSVSCQSTVKSSVKDFSGVHIMDNKLVLSRKRGKGGQSQQTFPIRKDFMLSVDHCVIVGGLLHIYGWVFRPEYLRHSLLVGLAVGDAVVLPPRPCGVERPDVLQDHNLPVDLSPSVGFLLRADISRYDISEAVMLLVVDEIEGGLASTVFRLAPSKLG